MTLLYVSRLYMAVVPDLDERLSLYPLGLFEDDVTPADGGTEAPEDDAT